MQRFETRTIYDLSSNYVKYSSAQKRLQRRGKMTVGRRTSHSIIDFTRVKSTDGEISDSVRVKLDVKVNIYFISSGSLKSSSGSVVRSRDFIYNNIMIQSSKLARISNITKQNIQDKIADVPGMFYK